MTVLITGNGHSGTTFIARLLMEVGCDFGQGDPPAAWTEGAQAMEHPGVQSVAKDVAQGHVAAAVAVGIALPPYVKAPAIGWRLDDWLGAGLMVGAAVVCHRNTEDTLHSIARTGGGYGGFGTPTTHQLHAQTGCLMSALWDYDIPHTVVRFPQVLDHWLSLYKAFRDAYIPLPCTEEAFRKAHARIARPKLVHFK